MRIKLKVLMSIALAFLLVIGSIPMSASATSTMQVSAEPTIIDVTITPSVNMTINPNIVPNSPGAIVYNKINVVNNSKAPVRFISTGLTKVTDSWFELVPKTTYASWKYLSKEESKKIALALKLTEGWLEIPSSHWSTSEVGSKMEGVLGAGTSGVIELSDSQVYYGTSFDSPKSSEFILNWSVSLK